MRCVWGQPSDRADHAKEKRLQEYCNALEVGRDSEADSVQMLQLSDREDHEKTEPFDGRFTLSTSAA